MWVVEIGIAYLGTKTFRVQGTRRFRLKRRATTFFDNYAATLKSGTGYWHQMPVPSVRMWKGLTCCRRPQHSHRLSPTLTRSQRKRLRKKKPVVDNWPHPLVLTSSQRRAWRRSMKRKEMLALLDDAFSVALTAKYAKLRPSFRTIAA